MKAILYDLVKRRTILPDSLVLSGVHKISATYVKAGGMADIYRGVYGGKAVALKVLRFYDRPGTTICDVRPVYHRFPLECLYLMV